MSDARQPGPEACTSAENLLLIFATHRPRGREALRAALAIEVQRAIDEKPAVAPGGSSHAQAHALCSILTEIVATLGFQPTIPMEHKTDLMNALTEFKHAFGIK